MSEIHTIPPSDLPAAACHWPACADPVCDRNEAGTCPLSDEIIVECGHCGTAKAVGTQCYKCGSVLSEVAPSPADSFYEYPDPSSVAMGEALYPPDGEAALAATAEPTTPHGITTGAAHDLPIYTTPDEPAFQQPRTQKRSSRPVLIVADDATVIRHTRLRGLLEVAGNMTTLGEAIGVDPSTISRALAGSGGDLSRDERIAAVRSLLSTEEGS